MTSGRWRRWPRAGAGISPPSASRSLRSAVRRRSAGTSSASVLKGPTSARRPLRRGEERDFRRGLERAGFGSNLTRAGMERLGFFVGVEDLEHEVVRALGAPATEQSSTPGELGRSVRSRNSLRRGAEPQGAALAVHVEPEDPLRAVARARAGSRSRATAARRRACRGHFACSSNCGEIVGDLEPRRLGSDEDVMRRPDAGCIARATRARRAT